MARIHKRQVAVGFGKETTKGTAVAASIWYPSLDLSFADNIDRVTQESSFGVLDKNSGRYTVKQWGEGDIEGAVYKNLFGHILTNFFGQTPTTTTVETTAKKHVWTMLGTSNSHITHTISIDDANEDLRFAYGMLTSLTITYAVDDFVRFTGTFMSKKSSAVSNTVSYVADTKFLPNHAVIKAAATGSSNLTAASALTNIRAVTLEFNKNVKATQALGSTDLEALYAGEFEVTGTIERFYDDTTFRGYARNNTERSLRFDLIDTATTVGAITNPSLRFDFEQVSFEFPEQGDDDGLLTESIGFTALWNVSAGKTVTAELTNDTASY
jgi:hypothetical protein